MPTKCGNQCLKHDGVLELCSVWSTHARIFAHFCSYYARYRGGVAWCELVFFLPVSCQLALDAPTGSRIGTGFMYSNNVFRVLKCRKQLSNIDVMLEVWSYYARCFFFFRCISSCFVAPKILLALVFVWFTLFMPGFAY